jgi:RNA polymerase sigma-70 factor (ECF subfamily)
MKESFRNNELIVKAQSGNQQALNFLIQRFLPDVFNLSLRYMQNSFDAEDATQEAFVKIWKNLERFDTDKSFKNWILEVTKNTCLDILKKKRIIPFSAFETEDGTNALTDTLASNDLSLLELVEQSGLKNTLQRLSRKLSPVYQKILFLYYDQELNFREISEELDEPINTVKSRHRRALLMLRKLLTGSDASN